MSEPFLALFTHSEVLLSLLEGLVLRPLPFDFPRSTMQTERFNVALIKVLECADKRCILPKQKNPFPKWQDVLSKR